MSRSVILSLSALSLGYVVGRWLRPAAPTVIGAHSGALPSWVT